MKEQIEYLVSWALKQLEKVSPNAAESLSYWDGYLQGLYDILDVIDIEE